MKEKIYAVAIVLQQHNEKKIIQILRHGLFKAPNSDQALGIAVSKFKEQDYSVALWDTIEVKDK